MLATSGDQIDADLVPDRRVELKKLSPGSILDMINESVSGIADLVSDGV
jgi:hypothetical protein